MDFENKESIKNHYNQIPNKSIEERETTRNINIRKANNYIKNKLLFKYIKRNARVLDIGVGKGGDLKKYHQIGIAELYGIDVANRSILDATERARSGHFTFKITLKTLDGYSTEFNLRRVFDVVSIQFSFHYAFASEETLNTAINNIDIHLRYDGFLLMTIPSKKEILKRKEDNNLSNSYYSINFVDPDSKEYFGNAYYYSLVDSVDSCIEYLVDMDLLTEKMRLKGFELVEHRCFKNFLHSRDTDCRQTSRPHDFTLNSEEEEVVDLHDVVVFRKLK